MKAREPAKNHRIGKIDDAATGDLRKVVISETKRFRVRSTSSTLETRKL